jgi:type IV secretion system protein VirB6
MPVCPASADLGLVHGLVESVDCHIHTFVQGAYSDLVGPGTMFATVFTGLLTIYIALIGYQLLLGRGGLRLTEMPVIALKVGLILAFLTSWAAYQTVVYDLLFDGPRTLMYSLLQPMTAQGGFDGDVYGGIERAYADLSEAATVYGSMASPNANILQGGPMLGAGILWLSAGTMLMSTLGVILAAKIVLGFLLAVGPVFIGLFLFDQTRGFFDGWLRVTVGFALAPLAASVFAAGMLLMLGPFVSALLENAQARVFDMGAIMTVALVVAVFAVVMAQVLRLGAGIAAGFTSNITGRGAPTFAPDLPQLREEGAQNGRNRAGEMAARSAAGEAGPRGGSGEASGADRRIGAAVEAVRAERLGDSARLGQSYRRLPTPTRRKSDGGAE